MKARYPWWKWSVIAVAVAAGLFYCAPNLFGEDPGLVVRGVRGVDVDAELLDQSRAVLENAGIEVKRAALEQQRDTSLRFQFDDVQARDRARSELQQALGNRYTLASARISAEPELMTALKAKPLQLGLDLQGGVHLLLEVDLDSVVQQALERSVRSFRMFLRENRIRYRSIQAKAQAIEIRLREPVADFEQRLSRAFPNVEVASVSQRDYRIFFTPAETADLIDAAINQNLASLRNRVDALGVSEPLVQRQGERRIVIELPGVQDPARAKQILGRAATLEFRLVDEDNDPSLGVPADTELYDDRFGDPILLKKEILYTGDNIINAAASFDSLNNTPIVSITLDATGERINRRVTGENIGRRMAVVYMEQFSQPALDAAGEPVVNEQGDVVYQTETIREVITAPVIRDQLGRRYQIEGLDSVQEARDLSLLLRAGALAAPVRIVEERTVGPSLGADNIRQGVRSVVIAFALVLLFMFYYYRLFGWLANLALSLNLIMIVALLSMLQATLTLPGVVGLVLTVGMAVDANVLIFERIREEIRNGNSPLASLNAGYARALSTILDANLTTLIAAVVLFNFGTGPIRGFAVTLSLGILTSMFTSIVITKGIALAIYTRQKKPKLAI